MGYYWLVCRLYFTCVKERIGSSWAWKKNLEFQLALGMRSSQILLTVGMS